MALTNFSLPFGALGQPWGVTLAPLHPIYQLASNTNNLLYSPADHQQQNPVEGADPEYFKNNPYGPPQSGGYQYQSTAGRRKQSNAYLPPTAPSAVRNSVYHIQQVQQTQQQQQQHQHQQQQQQDQNENSVSFQSSSSSSRSSSTTGQSSVQLTQTHGRGPAEGSYSRYPGQPAQPQPQQQQQKQFFSAHGSASTTFSKNSGSFSITSFGSRAQQAPPQQQQPQSQPQQPPPSQQQQPPPAPPPLRSRQAKPEAQPAQTYGVAPPENYPERAPGFTRVQAGQGSRTQVHAVLDYDVEEGEEDEEEDGEDEGQYLGGQEKNAANNNQMPTVTPIQGPIYLKNGTVPVVPLFSYPKLNNGSFLQIPIWWTALSVALGLDVRGDVIKGVPCIKRYHQLFCPTAGNSYPIDKIERFIDDNKALMRRMYGDFEMNMEGPGVGAGRQQAQVRKRRFIDEPDIFIPPGAFAANSGESMEAGDSYFGQLRKKRQAAAGGNRNRGASAGGSGNGNTSSRPPGNGNASSGTGRLDACESKIEIVTPYWASNSAGKIRAIVNTQHFEQAIHQEVCSNTQTPRCEGECGCEQKYKWHRLLAYDPDNDCKGIFMDWFLFPSCCVCRCNP
ncbi:protein spaetzle 3 isoform X2 [Drosophila biarmipes]|uniref:protein spaetzle 3 isoform X2 n=1 Tax=Drosophila biarmipes TaxID=125945 RepID=UPI0007E813CA|nr:protein spaetzle 3 isoform X2 [Drosophila biarmipes]